MSVQLNKVILLAKSPVDIKYFKITFDVMAFKDTIKNAKHYIDRRAYHIYFNSIDVYITDRKMFLYNVVNKSCSYLANTA